MHLNGVIIEDEFAEAFRMWAARLVVTAIDAHWVQTAVHQVTGYGTSVIGCDAEAGLERTLAPRETPDGRPGAAVLLFAFNAKALSRSLPARTGQCLLTCPTTAVYDGLPDVVPSEDTARIDLGRTLRYFGDGFQKSKVIGYSGTRGREHRRYWRVPVMDGEFVVEESAGAVKAIGGGNFLICGTDQARTLQAAMRAVDAVRDRPDIITPFPGGVVRSGSKVGSRYRGLVASTNDAYCPTLRSRVETRLRPEVNCVYEIVINGLNETAIRDAIRSGIEAAIEPPADGVVAISAGNYGGKLGKFHFKLHEILKGAG